MTFRSAATNGGRTSYRIDGSSQPLVLIHGLQVGQELFDNIVGHLSDSYTVIMYDQRDIGDNAFAPEPYSVADLADNLVTLLHTLEIERAHVLGTSYGGMVAQIFALRHPELLDRWVLAGGSQHPLDPGMLPTEAQTLLDGVANGDGAAARELPGRFASGAAAATKSIAAVGTGSGSLGAEALARRFTPVRHFDTRGLLASVDAQTLVLHGRNDPVLRGEDALSMALELPRGSLLLLDGVGHTWENEEPLARSEAPGTDGAMLFVRPPADLRCHPGAGRCAGVCS